MKRVFRWVLLGCMIFATSAAFARRHDPLTSEEVDQLREVALEPEKRLKLLADFARQRLAAIESAVNPVKPVPGPANANKPEAEPRPLHDLMQDFQDVYDELDENIGMYEDRQSDLSKALKPVLIADHEFHARLDGLQHNLTPEQRTDCDFVLTSIVETINNGTADHKKMLAEQEVAFKNKKKD
jgi:hypothetical protein